MTDLHMTPKAEVRTAKNQKNEKALENIRRELNAQVFDREKFKADLQKKINSQSYQDRRDRKIDVESEIKNALRWVSSAEWSDTDKATFRRCAMWIAHADGFGIELTNEEAISLASRNREKVASAARQIILRLSGVVVVPPDESMILARSEVLRGIIGSGDD